MSRNHSYDTPAEGTVDWHLPLNENFEALDADVEIRDHDGNRADYAPKAGAKFFAVDTGDIYYGDGSEWRHVGTVANVAGDVYVQDTEPADAGDGDIWIDTSN